MYNSMLHDGMAPEMARMVLPQSMMTEWIWSGNLLAFAHMYKERIASGAQQEAQEFAQQLNEAIGDLAPVSWQALTNG
jgi:thymidylate synthase (FAD)